MSLDHFAKDCFSAEQARVEESILRHLRNRLGEDVAPRPISVSGSVLIMERLVGARFYDLLRHLEAQTDDTTKIAVERIRDILFQRARERLRAIQIELTEVAPLLSGTPYPLESKLHRLLELLIGVLDLRRIPNGWSGELRAFARYWDSECVSIPFRDATAKNIIICDERLRLPLADDAEDAPGGQDGVQRAAVLDLIQTEGDSFWQTVPMRDLDFSSVVHLTSIEDDPVSLHCHEWTLGSSPISAESFVLDPVLGTPNHERAAASFLVRYLRFGGRKLAYKVINSQGSKIRFAYDDPLFYFKNLRTICLGLSPLFVEEYSNIFELIDNIARAVRDQSKADKALLSVDHLRRYYSVGQYWQQNPSEWRNQAGG